MESSLKNSEVAKLLVQKTFNFGDHNINGFPCKNLKPSHETITENSLKNKTIDSTPITSFTHIYNKNNFPNKPNQRKFNKGDITTTLDSHFFQNKTLFSILPSQSRNTSTPTKWPPIDLSVKPSKNKNIGTFEMQNLLNPTSVHLDKVPFDGKEAIDNDNAIIKIEQNNDSRVTSMNSEMTENHSSKDHNQVTNQLRNQNSKEKNQPSELSETYCETLKSTNQQSGPQPAFCNFFQTSLTTPIISSQIDSHSNYTQATNSLNKARYSIIHTNPSITSLLLDKHASNNTSVYSLRFIPVVTSAAFETNRPSSALEINKNFKESFYKSGSPRYLLTIIPNSEKVPLIASECHTKKPAEALKSLLLKPSTLEDTHPKNLCNFSETNVFSIKNSTANKIELNLTNENKLLNDIKNNELKIKIKSEVITCEDESGRINYMSNEHGCDGCNCGCEFCPEDGLKKKQMLNDLSQDNQSESISIKRNGFIDSPTNFTDRVEKKNTIESLLLLKNGYKLNTNSQNKKELNNNYFSSKFEHKLSSLDNEQNSFKPNNFLFSADNITKFKQTFFDNSKNKTPRCCSNETQTNTNNKITENFSNKNSCNKQTLCLPKRKFIEMKNKDFHLKREMNQQTNNNSLENCGMPCCKKTRQNSENITSKFNICTSSCSPLNCMCSQPKTNDSSNLSNKNIEEKSFDDISLSETSTISVTPLKSDPDEGSNALMDASTQWCFEDSDKSIFYKDFSTQCSFDEQLKPETCKLCNCCIQSESSNQSSFPIALNNITENVLDFGVIKDKKTLNDIQMKCYHCGIIFDDEVIFSIHMGSHSHHSPFTCNLCGKKCLNKYGFNTHVLHGHHYVSS